MPYSSACRRIVFALGRLRRGRVCRGPGPGRNELVLGSVLARRLGLKVGSPLLPFYHSSRGDHISRVVGVFKPDGPLWQSNLMLTTFDTAADVFDQHGLATDLLVSCRPGYQDAVTRRSNETLSFPTPTAAAWCERG